MKRTDDATLDDRPESLNAVGVNCTMHILPLTVARNAMREAVAKPIASMLIGRDQADAIGYNVTDKRIKDFFAGIGDHSCNQIALALDSADDDFLARSTSTTRRTKSKTAVLWTA
jgi:hypothetical protein